MSRRGNIHGPGDPRPLQLSIPAAWFSGLFSVPARRRAGPSSPGEPALEQGGRIRCALASRSGRTRSRERRGTCSLCVTSGRVRTACQARAAYTAAAIIFCMMQLPELRLNNATAQILTIIPREYERPSHELSFKCSSIWRQGLPSLSATRNTPCVRQGERPADRVLGLLEICLRKR